MSRIAIWAGGNWNPDTLLGGSEECVVMLAQTMTEQGHKVRVYNDIEESIGFPRDDFRKPYTEYVPQHLLLEHFRLLGMGYYDLLIVQREWRKVIEARKIGYKGKIVLYCHDIPVDPHFPQSENDIREFLDAVDYVVVLNHYHRNLYHRVPDEKIKVIPIGVNLEDYIEIEKVLKAADIKRNPYKCLYFSHPHRGLMVLRQAWKQIKSAVPEAELHSFWWEPELFLPPDEELGIKPMQSLKRDEIAYEVLTSGLFVYPSVFGAEISPATTIKAQVGGAVPIVVVAGGMVDTVRHGHKASMDSFVIATINALRDHHWQETVRGPMMEDMRQRHSWSRAAEEFIALL